MGIIVKNLLLGLHRGFESFINLQEINFVRMRGKGKAKKISINKRIQASKAEQNLFVN